MVDIDFSQLYPKTKVSEHDFCYYTNMLIGNYTGL